MPLLGILLKQFIQTRSEIKLRKRNPLRQQHIVLRKLLRKAQMTAFGQEYSFMDLLMKNDIETAFSKTVPVFDYNKIYKEWWHKTLEGERDICWTGKTKYFALSSGTSESASKRIPITKDMISAIRRASLKQIIAMANFNFPVESYEKGILMLGGSTNLKHKGDYFEGDLSGISASKIPNWFHLFYKPGKKIARETDWEKKLDEIARTAKNWDIAHICGIPAWNQLLLERIIKHHQVKTIHDVWPNLTSFVHGGVSFDPYKKGFEKLLAKPLTYIDTYLASEGFIAYQVRPETRAMQLITNNGIYYEFIPFNDSNFDADGNLKPEAMPIGLKDVDDKTDYAILLSTCAGAWRYLIGDTIRFTNLKRAEIIITGRTKHFLSLCGEHLSVENMNDAIAKVSSEMNIGIREFTVAGVPANGTFAHRWFIGSDDKVDKEALKKRIDTILKELNDDYEVERKHALKDLIIDVLPTKVFNEWMERHHKLGGQNKFPRVLKGERLDDWMQFLEERNKKVLN